MVKRSCSGVPWYSKNWLILKIQPSGSVPSNLGTSNFILCVDAGTGWEWGNGGGVAVEDESKGETRWRSSLIFKVMECIDSPKYSYWLVRWTRAPSSLSKDPETLLGSPMRTTRAPMIGPLMPNWLRRSWPPGIQGRRRREIKGNCIFYIPLVIYIVYL